MEGGTPSLIVSIASTLCEMADRLFEARYPDMDHVLKSEIDTRSRGRVRRDLGGPKGANEESLDPLERAAMA